jgi:hypothetical protein
MVLSGLENCDLLAAAGVEKNAKSFPNLRERHVFEALTLLRQFYARLLVYNPMMDSGNGRISVHIFLRSV